MKGAERGKTKGDTQCRYTYYSRKSDPNRSVFMVFSFVCQCYLHPLSFLADLFVLRPVLNFTLTSFCLTVLFASTTLSCRPACVEASAGFDTLGCSNAEYDTASI